MTLRLLIVLLLAPLAARAQDAVGHWATVNGHRIYYEDRGAGSVIVLLHGGGGDIPGAWSHQLEPFSRAHRVIAIEQAGHGHSPDVDGPMTYDRFTEDTAALLGQLGLKKVDVVGWSDGAIEALMLAVRHPDLVRRVVATGANVDPSGVSQEATDWARKAKPSDVFSAGPDSYYGRHSEDGAAHAPVIGAKLQQLWLTRPVPEELTFEKLHTIAAPVLVMAGDHDEITLEHTLRIYQAIPGARLWILPGTDHGTFVDRPDWTNPLVLDFLEKPLK
jgi:pimeloyl-ACP methyl ester carboxylesterase